MIEKLDNAKAFSVDLSPAEKRTMTNEAFEAAILSGRWNGTQQVVALSVDYNGVATLPREFLTAKAAKVNGIVRDMANPWYNFLPLTSDISQWSTNIQDRGDGFVVFKQPKQAAKLRFACSDDNTSTVEVHGTDANGAEIYTGSLATQRGTVLVFNAVKAAPYFTTVTELVKPITNAQGFLYACYDDSTEEIIGIYAPGESVPSYRQYLIQEAISEDPAAVVTPIAMFCQRRHVDLVADNDICPISNFRAMKYLVKHVHWDNESDETRADKALDKAVDFLNMELKQLRAPGEKGIIRVRYSLGGAVGLHSMR